MKTWTGRTTDLSTTLLRPVEFDLDSHRPWLRHMAAQMRPRHDEAHEDLIQEGAIAMWKAHLAFDPKRGIYEQHIRIAARSRMRDIASQRKKPLRPTDLQNRGAKEPKRDRLTTYEAVVGIEPDSDTPAEQLLLDPAQPGVFDHVEAGYHRGEVLRAVAELPDELREYVVRRFWGGLDSSVSGRRAAKALGHEDMTGRKAHIWREACELLEFKLSHVSDGFGD